MAHTTKSSPGILVILIAVGVVVGLFMTGNLPLKEYLGRGEDKEVCFDVTSLPEQELVISWRVGEQSGSMRRTASNWDTCRPAQTGQYATLTVEPYRSSNLACTIWMRGGKEVDSRNTSGDKVCHAVGYVK